jgi:hypothetical protein
MIGKAILLIAIIVGALAMARAQMEYDILDVRRSGAMAAGVRYLVISAGLLWAGLCTRQMWMRFVAYGMVLLTSLAIRLLGPQLSVGYLFDPSCYFDVGTFYAACACTAAGFVTRVISWLMSVRR